MTLRFHIPGDPVAKGSRTVGRRKDGSTYTREASARVKPWMTAASQALWVQAQQQRARFGVQPVRVTALFACERPAKPSHPYPSRGDLDKFARLLCDVLVQAAVIADDRHVVELEVRKAFAIGEPGVSGRVTAVDVESFRAAA